MSSPYSSARFIDSEEVRGLGFRAIADGRFLSGVGAGVPGMHLLRHHAGRRWSSSEPSSMPPRWVWGWGTARFAVASTYSWLLVLVCSSGWGRLQDGSGEPQRLSTVWPMPTPCSYGFSVASLVQALRQAGRTSSRHQESWTAQQLDSPLHRSAHSVARAQPRLPLPPARMPQQQRSTCKKINIAQDSSGLIPARSHADQARTDAGGSSVCREDGLQTPRRRRAGA